MKDFFIAIQLLEGYKALRHGHAGLNRSRAIIAARSSPFHSPVPLRFPNPTERCDNRRIGAVKKLECSASEENIVMKRFLICTTLLAVAATLTAQQTSQKAPPKSPAATESATIGGKTIITITYSSPRVRDRAGKIFTKDGLISKDHTYPVWRAGANAATKLQTDADLKIGGLNCPQGRLHIVCRHRRS